MSTNKAPARKQAHDSVDIERLPIAVTHLAPQPSAAPGEEVMDGCTEDEDWAIAIRDSWQVSMPVKRVTTLPDRTTEFIK